MSEQEPKTSSIPGNGLTGQAAATDNLRSSSQKKQLAAEGSGDVLTFLKQTGVRQAFLRKKSCPTDQDLSYFFRAFIYIKHFDQTKWNYLLGNHECFINTPP